MSAATSDHGDAAPVLSVIGLTKTFGDRRAVDEVSFEISPGETYGLLGPNGAGKTTTISMIAGLLRPDAGHIRLCGFEDGPTRREARAHLGLVPQDLAIYPDLTARENLVLFGRLQGIGRQRLRERVDEVLEVIGLTDRSGDLTKEYSGGMKRRLNIGIGLLHQPDLLILDEPTVGVDPQSRNAILESVESLSREGLALLYTTHYMEEAERLCDRIGIVDQGSMVAEGTVNELLRITGEADAVSLSGSGSVTEATRALGGATGVLSASGDGTTISLTVADAPTHLASLLATAARAGMAVTDVDVSRPDLEDVFLHLTGRALRD